MRKSPRSEPKFHQYEILEGVGRFMRGLIILFIYK